MSLRSLLASHRDGELDKLAYIEQMHQRHGRLFEYAEYLRETDVGSIEIVDGAVIVTMRESGLRLHLDPVDRRATPMGILNFGSIEGTELRTLLKLVPAARTILDIGANHGWFTLNFSAAAPDAAIHAFEPIPATRAWLEKNLALNRVANVELHSFGFSTEPGEQTFYFAEEESGSASLANIRDRDSVQHITCELRRLDDFVAERGLSVDLIKCDVEGAELLVFKGGQKTLAEQRPVVFVEMLRIWAAKFDYHPNEIISLLSGMGYGCFTMNPEGLRPFGTMDEGTSETNFLFLHQQQHAEPIRDLSA